LIPPSFFLLLHIFCYFSIGEQYRICNESSVTIYIKLEDTSDKDENNIIALRPGERYEGKIDGFTTADGRVIKVRDKWWNPFTPNVVVKDEYSEVRGILSPLAKEIKSPPDKGWKPIFQKAKEMRAKYKR